MVKIYTKTGDEGETSLFTSERVSKDCINIAALGSIDETNSALGAALSVMPAFESFETIREQLLTIQHALFDVGAAVATPLTKATTRKLEKTRFSHEAITKLEQWIDEHQSQLPQLKHFILPGGHPSAAMLHVGRAMCRRAERDAIPLFKQGEINHDVLMYLNRLSDYLFVLARRVNSLSGCPDTLWEQHKY